MVSDYHFRDCHRNHVGVPLWATRTATRAISVPKKKKATQKGVAFDKMTGARSQTRTGDFLLTMQAF